MLQRGVNLTSLDVSYVSSLSWYFINFFGLRGIFALILADSSGSLGAVCARAVCVCVCLLCVCVCVCVCVHVLYPVRLCLRAVC